MRDRRRCVFCLVALLCSRYGFTADCGGLSSDDIFFVRLSGVPVMSPDCGRHDLTLNRSISGEPEGFRVS